MTAFLFVLLTPCPPVRRSGQSRPAAASPSAAGPERKLSLLLLFLIVIVVVAIAIIINATAIVIAIIIPPVATQSAGLARWRDLTQAAGY